MNDMLHLILKHLHLFLDPSTFVTVFVYKYSELPRFFFVCECVSDAI